MHVRFLLAATTLVAVELCAATSAVAATTTTTGVGQGSSSSTTTGPTIRPVFVDPLTHLPDPHHLTKHRSALTIKVENTPEAHPQAGIDQADVIYEEIVEGGITRLAAIFDAHLPTKVGPVRSVRRTDREIVAPIHGIFVFSGGAPYALTSIESAPVTLFDESNAGAAMFRDPTRYAPHNLYANAVRLMAMGPKPYIPPPLFSYGSFKAPATGIRVGSFVVNFPAGYAVSYQWDRTTHSWVRSIFAHPDFTATHVRLSPTNVIVMKVHYLGGLGRLGAEAQLVGSGPVDVFSDGRLQRGDWFRSQIGQRTVYRNVHGQTIDLRPGQTWVELLDASETVSVVAPK